MIIRTIAVKCDGKGCRKKTSLQDGTVDAVRQQARWQDWTTGYRGDFCPTHRAGA